MIKTSGMGAGQPPDVSGAFGGTAMAAPPLYSGVTAHLACDGNYYAAVKAVVRALQRTGNSQAVEQFNAHAFGCATYDDLIALTQRTVNLQWEN
jgi:hypothetical protein